MGPITLKTQYYSLSNKTAANEDSKMWALGADYALSKRTTAQVAYSKVTNEANASYGGVAVVAGSDALTIAGGADPHRFSLGLKHTF
jgi:predicted porin